MKQLINGLISLGVFGFCLLPAPLLAATHDRLSAYPTAPNPSDPYSGAWFRYRLPPGQTRDGSVTIDNDSNRVKTISLYPVDATATKDGKLAMRNQEETRREVGAWITLEAAHLKLQPHHKVTALFRIAIPPDASVGDHVGGIVVQEDKPQLSTTRQGVHLQIVSRLAVRVYETIPGAKIRALKITDYHVAASDHLAASITLTNKGNVTLVPDGQIKLIDTWGQHRETLPFPPVMLLPHHSVQIALKSSLHRPIIQRYRVELTLNYSRQKMARSLTVIWLDPIKLLLLGLIAITITTLIRLYQRKHAV